MTKETASLNGTVDPRGATIAECEFEYGVADEFGRGAYQHSAACEPAAVGIGSGSVPSRFLRTSKASNPVCSTVSG